MAADRANTGYFSMGPHTLSVPRELFALNRLRLLDRLRTKAPRGLVLLQGGKDSPIHDTDCTFVFQQESYFHWMFGVEVPDFYGALDVASGCSYLFAPEVSESDAIFMGALPSNNDLKTKYCVDEVFYIKESGVNSDSDLPTKEAKFDGMSAFKVNNKILYPEITECRVIKTPLELDVLRYVNKVSSQAHKLVMRNMKPGMYEYQGEAMFQQYCYYSGGCRDVGYTCICTSGKNNSVLHYGHAGAPNNKQIKDGDMLLFDMGGKYCGYIADITVTFPANGKFTKLQAAVYNAVLNARNAVLAAVRPGVSWVDMHKLANREMLTGLKDAGILAGDIDLMMKANLGAVFQPHGLGHLMGCDVHDVGGYLPDNPPRIDLPGLRCLRTARILQAGMVLTVEPGCYFIDMLLDAALKDSLQAKFFVPAMIELLRGSGGVRIEDDIIVTQDGYEMMTDVPRTVEEIEKFLADKKDLH